MDYAQTTARGDNKHLSFRIWCDLYWSFYGNRWVNQARESLRQWIDGWHMRAKIEPHSVVLFHNDFSPSGEQPEQGILAHKL